MDEDFKFPDEQEAKKGGSIRADDDGDDIEIEVVDDTPAQDRGRKPLDREVEDPTDDEIEKYSDKVQARIKELTHARHDERRAKEAVLRERQELERLAQQLIAENNSLKKSVNVNQTAFIHTAQEKAQVELETARRKLKEAHEAFDTDAIIAAQELLADAKMRIETTKNFRPTPLQETEVAVQPQQSRTQQVQPDEKSLNWQAKNQWFGAPGNEEYTSYALGLHQKLVSSGLDPRSDEYFGQIDARMRSTFPELVGADKPKSGDVSKRPTSVVAPATRSSGVTKIKLSTTQIALAKKFGLTPQQYAAQVAKLENQNG